MVLPDSMGCGTNRSDSPAVTLHGTVRSHAERSPDQVALRTHDAAVSYGMLNHAADVYARELHDAGVRRGDVVPLLVSRDPAMVAMLLAVMKLGAAYALLDEKWPDERIRDAATVLDAPLMVVSWRNAGRSPIPAWPAPAEPLTRPAGRPGGGPRPAVTGSDPCCVFFTSGTTGRPKAVLTPHRAVLRLFRTDTFARFGHETVMPQAAPLPWDGFALELWSMLSTGGTSLILDEPYLSAHALRDSIKTCATDTAWLTASLFNMIVDEDVDAFDRMRQVMIGGERLSVTHVRRFLERHPGIALINGYGPVESTVFATTHRITVEDCQRPWGIPLGRPVPDTQVYVMDGPRLCAVDEPGELCIAGDGLALGYLGDASLTAEKFPSMVIEGEPTPVYRTGDAGWRDAEGLLHYRGRLDRQVKIRGHRVEPAEVERQIERLRGVRRCVVAARRDANGSHQALVAFCVPARPGDELSGTVELLRSRLLPHQVPEQVLSLDAFPLSANGKVDERALLALLDAPATSRDDDDHAGEPSPGPDDLLARVVQVFASVLDRSAVPADASFFGLGGTSLAAGRVCARLAAELDCPVPVERLLRNPTARALTGWLRENAAELSRTAELPGTAELPRTAEPGPPAASGVPLSSTQAGFLTRQLLDPRDRSAYCLGIWRIDGDLDHGALSAAVRAVHERHEPLGAAYVPLRGHGVARAGCGPAPGMTVLAEAASVGDAVAALRRELSRELDITAGQVWRTAMARSAPGPDGAPVHVFGYVVHHIAFDGWSESVLAEDLAAAYEEHRTGRRAGYARPPSLAEAWEIGEARRRHADIESQRAALHAHLRDVPPLPHPIAGEAPAGGGDASVPLRVERTLGAVDVARLDGIARPLGVTRFVVLLAAYGHALSRLTGRSDFAVGVPMAGRADGRLDRSVGCHITMACIRMRDEALSCDAGAVAATGPLVDLAFGTQDVGFGEVVRMVNPPRSRRPPLFQNILVYQDNEAPRLALGNARTRFLRQSYLGIPVELQTDVWPLEDGSLRIVSHHLPTAIGRDSVGELQRLFEQALHAISLPAATTTQEDR